MKTLLAAAVALLLTSGSIAGPATDKDHAELAAGCRTFDTYVAYLDEAPVYPHAVLDPDAVKAAVELFHVASQNPITRGTVVQIPPGYYGAGTIFIMLEVDGCMSDAFFVSGPLAQPPKPSGPTA